MITFLLILVGIIAGVFGVKFVVPMLKSDPNVIGTPTHSKLSNPFTGPLPKHFWSEDSLKILYSQSFGHSDYSRRCDNVEAIQRGQRGAHDVTLFRKMEKMYNNSTDSMLRAGVAVMVENHLLPAYYTSLQAIDAEGERRYQEELRIISSNLDKYIVEYNRAIQQNQEVSIRHLRAVNQALHPQKSDLDLS